MTREDELSRNYEAFRVLLPGLMATHRGQFALMHDRELVACFDTARDAFLAGEKLYAGRAFSIQEVTDTEADLGYFSHALPGSQV